MNKEDWLKIENTINDADSRELVIIKEIVNKEIMLAKDVVEEGMRKEEYYVCPKCGDVTTEKELLEACSSGGMPYCYCEFIPDRIYIGYKKISKKEYLKRKMLKNLE